MRLALALLATLASAFAQTRQERGKQIVDEMITALGGQKFLTTRNRVETGRAYSFYREELSGLSIATIYTRYLDPPEAAPGELLVRERQSFGKEERYGATLFTGGNGYQITFRGARPIPQDSLERYKDSTLHNIFYILRGRLHDPGMLFEYQGSDILDNLPVDKLTITDPDNQTVTVWVQQSTHLPMRQLYYRRDPKTGDRIEEVTIFAKYRDIGDGVNWPFDVQRLRNGDRIFQMYADSVAVNQDLDEKLFTLPAGIKMLKPLK